jgi:hypothetical protein
VVKTPKGDPSLELDQQQRRPKQMQAKHGRRPSTMAVRALWVAEARYGSHWQQLRYRRLRTQEGMLQALGESKAVSSRSRQARAGHLEDTVRLLSTTRQDKSAVGDLGERPEEGSWSRACAHKALGLRSFSSSPRQNTNTSANSQTPTQTIEGSGVRGQQQRGDTRQPTSQQTYDRPPRRGSGHSKERVRLCLFRFRNDRPTSDGLTIREPARK